MNGGRSPQAPLEPPLFTIQIVAVIRRIHREKNNINEKAFRETQTLRAGCSKVRTPPARCAQTHRQDRLQYTAPQLASAQCNYVKSFPNCQRRLRQRASLLTEFSCENLKCSKRSLMMSIFANLNSFIRKRITVKSSDLTSATVKEWHSIVRRRLCIHHR